MNLFSFPDDARWNAAAGALEFGVGFGEYRGIVRIRRQVFQNLLEQRPTPERCIEAYHLCRSEFERVAEAKLRARALSGDGNIDLTLRDLRHVGRSSAASPPEKPLHSGSGGDAGHLAHDSPFAVCDRTDR
jgi:hypothetical protein